MQLARKIFSLWILLTALSTCTEPYNPSIEVKNASKYVVFGQLNDQEGYQTISVSMSTSIEKPINSPVTNCTVKIIDNHGNTFDLIEFKEGYYHVWMNKESLNPGTAFQATIITPSGIEIVSDFEQMPDIPEIDSVYYIRKDLETANPQKPKQGIQFYIDVDGGNTNSRYYRWDIIETWEHHAVFPKEWYWNKYAIVQMNPPDYSRFYCWTTQRVKSIYTLSTEYLTQNRYKMHQLHYVDNLTQRLTFCYSINVIQYTLTKSAYLYWNKLRINSIEHGGLYDTQPLNVKGNLKSPSNPELEILGFFTASPSRTKRIFVRNVANLEPFFIRCEGSAIKRGELNSSKLRYLIVPQGGGFLIVQDECVECNRFGGTTIKPEYWPY